MEQHKIGRAPGELTQPVAAVIRAGQPHNFGHPSVQRLASGDKAVRIADVDRQMDDPRMDGSARTEAPRGEGR